ncbi:MAG: leucine--tRNA ligase [Candidatus Bostrichicola ureolyticus]|nr:MAG: leucine--tRNA ligase [Candidatus Bostrichicola ureolyticus]
MEYNFRYIEKYWQQYWKKYKIFQTLNIYKKPKFYILDMFPYPSGSGLHVGHLLGYIASDIYARYKRLQGYNVLHPMGFDSFGLPTEQYSIQTGNHPKKTTNINIKRYKEQLNNIGLSFDWDREIRTNDPKYYRWTQYIFIQLFNHWYDHNTNSAKHINKLIKIFEKNGNLSIKTNYKKFSSKEWKNFSLTTKENILQMYRLAFYSESLVNWCPSLGTVLANDEINNGKSKRGGYTVYKKKMIQWNLRITAYAERLLKGLEYLDWPNFIKESQINWIGKSIGVNIIFNILNHNYTIQIFTTRPETIFGVSFIVLSINHSLIEKITTVEQYVKVQEYIKKIESKNTNKNNISGEFTGAYALHPFTKTKIPIYISDYILDFYGTGAIMAVPAHDKRDHKFAKKFGLNILEVIKSNINVEIKAYEAKEGICINSYFINGLNVKEAIKIITKKIEEKWIGFSMINYHLHDAVFSRQRYWGEPIPIYFKQGIPKTIPLDKLPLILPNIDNYFPLKNGKSPLNRAKIWAWDEIKQKVVSNDLIDQKHVFPIETDTMPSWAGSSWYFIRYMDPLNKKNIVNHENESYWKNVDLYIGGSEHTTGHLIYARFYHKFLKDIGIVKTEEPFKKLINQGLILGYTAYIARDIKNNILISDELVKNLQFIQYIPIDINLLKNNNELDIKKFRKWHNEFFKANLYMKNRLFLCKRKMEKMSKSKFNIINQDIICDKYGADTLRLYEMFLGPLRYSKPWDIQGITGVHNFLKKFWMLFYNKNGTFYVDDKQSPSNKELKILHNTIKKIIDNMHNLSFNTSISTFMIAVNNLLKLKCNKRVILEPLVILLSPFAPHISEELWCKLGHKYSVNFSKIPKFCSEYLSEKNITYPIMINGKLKFKMDFEIDVKTEDIKNIILNDTKIINYLNGKKIKNFIFIPKKIINIVI